MWITSHVFISNRFYKTQKSYGPLNADIITEFSWVVTMSPAVPSTDILRWPIAVATVRTFLPRLLTAASRIQKCTYRKNIYVPNSPVELVQ